MQSQRAHHSNHTTANNQAAGKPQTGVPAGPLPAVQVGPSLNVSHPQGVILTPPGVVGTLVNPPDQEEPSKLKRLLKTINNFQLGYVPSHDALLHWIAKDMSRRIEKDEKFREEFLKPAILKHQDTLNRILDAVEEGRVKQDEMKHTLGRLQRWAADVDYRSLKDAGAREIIILLRQADTSPRLEHCLKASIPIIPPFLKYEVKYNLGTRREEDLPTIWDSIAKMRLRHLQKTPFDFSNPDYLFLENR